MNTNTLAKKNIWMIKTPSHATIKHLKKIVFLICLIPILNLVRLGFQDDLSANPIEFVERSTGYWALFLLLTTLTLTPFRLITKTVWLVQFRRMLGLFMFFYACLHITTYVYLDYNFIWEDIYKDIIKHPYVIVGLLAFLLTIPLAVTSNNAMIKRLGKKWKTLHKSVYLIAILGVLHFWWLVKKDLTEPVIFATVLVSLFSIRLYYHCKTS